MDIDSYAAVAGKDTIDHLRQLARPLAGMKIVHVNSTKVGGGVAEILQKLVPLMNDLGLSARWEVVTGSGEFFDCTKGIHNALQGSHEHIGENLWRAYESTNEENAGRLRGVLEEAEVVFIHDPQPAGLLARCPGRRGKWIWRCHIDLSRPYRQVWKRLREHVARYDASIFSLATFSQPLPHPQYLIPPSIDPLSDKNMELEAHDIEAARRRFGLDDGAPLITQISRFDRFKDPLGVIHAYKIAKKFTPSLRLVLAGGGATDDPEGELVLRETQAAARDDKGISVIPLAPDEHRTINALQRMSDIVIQKSIREGFGLTVTEALWKGKPVIGGDTGGIRLQVVDHHTGFLVNTPEGAALRIRYLLGDRKKMAEMGKKGREFVRENFLLTRHLREYLTLIHGLIHPNGERIELN